MPTDLRIARVVFLDRKREWKLVDEFNLRFKVRASTWKRGEMWLKEARPIELYRWFDESS